MKSDVMTVQHRQGVDEFDLVGTADILPIQHIARHRLRDPHQGDMEVGGHPVFSPCGIGNRADNITGPDRPSDMHMPMQYNMGIDRQKSMRIIPSVVDENRMAQKIAANGKGLT
ncbi:hypothetical protein HNQ81_003464 [Desulfoprunum benzoelyticum]|uniref:Uncharacterized protein n=1 Tax=Desulfoprunum benzoelyticum TaxID=1506996 RepID=A0A840UU29_9BACT|nr:hypothetical protein [Desulfoprunum benzoelyticum]MBB5349707.1 hypothetical protein [Desulfoprunum benzoelyticum]